VTIRIGRLVVHPASRIATIDDKRLRLTPKEYDILELRWTPIVKQPEPSSKV
jgi:DNA-binding response OmpR family regulator